MHRKFALVGLVASFFLSTPSSAMSSTWVTLCNETNKTIYVMARRYERSLFFDNAVTWGWTGIPVRGILRSCKNFNARLGTIYFAFGFIENGEIVPVRFNVHNAYRMRRDVYICGNKLGKYEEWSNDRLSQDSCIDADIRVRTTVGVISGDNDVTIDLR